MNTWERVEPGRRQAQWTHAKGYAIYRATLTPPKAIQSRGGRIIFRSIAGATDVFIGSTLVASKTEQAAALEINLPAGVSPVVLSVVVKWEGAAGLVDRVELL
jgi:beta-galactosidase